MAHDPTQFPAVQPLDAHNRRLLDNVHPPAWTNPQPKDRYHLVVVGAGTAGLVTAAIGAALGARVALVERELMGVDHQALGKGLAEMWRFPRSCQLVAGHHHQPQALSNDRLLVSVVYIADTIVAQKNHGFNLTALHQKLDDAGLEMPVDPLLIERVKHTLPNLLASAASSFA